MHFYKKYGSNFAIFEAIVNHELLSSLHSHCGRNPGSKTNHWSWSHCKWQKNIAVAWLRGHPLNLCQIKSTEPGQPNAVKLQFARVANYKFIVLLTLFMIVNFIWPLMTPQNPQVFRTVAGYISGAQSLHFSFAQWQYHSL